MTVCNDTHFAMAANEFAVVHQHATEMLKPKQKTTKKSQKRSQTQFMEDDGRTRTVVAATSSDTDLRWSTRSRTVISFN